LDKIGAGLITVDISFRIQTVSRAAMELLGYRREELLGCLIDRIVPQTVLRNLARRRRRAPAFPVFRETALRCKSGALLPVTLSAFSDNRSITCVIQDRREGDRARKESELLRAVMIALSRTGDLPTALAIVLQNVCEVTGWAFGEAWLPNAEGLRLVLGPVWATGRHLAAFAAASRRHTFRPGEGLPGRVWRSRKPAWIRDVRVDSNFPRARLATRVGLKGGFAVPVLGAGEVIAVLGFFVLEPRDEDDRLVELVTAVAAHLGSILQKRRMEKTLHINKIMLDAQELERRRLARELHDGVCQILSSIVFRMKGLEEGLRRRHGKEHAQATRAIDLLEHALGEVRRISRDLTPRAVEDFGLVSSVRQLGGEFTVRTGAHFRLFNHRFPARLPAFVSSNLYRIVQEALANAEKHSGATRVRVELWRRGSSIGVVIADNGKGFTFSRAAGGPDRPPRLGLANIRERARLVRGRFELHSSPDRGTVVRVKMPFDPKDLMEADHADD
jgi:PAS domain S-box-containing protein